MPFLLALYIIATLVMALVVLVAARHGDEAVARIETLASQSSTPRLLAEAPLSADDD